MSGLRGLPVARRDLTNVARQAVKLEKARALLRDAVLQANRSGESIRDIAEAGGLKKNQVEKLLREALEAERRQARERER